MRILLDHCVDWRLGRYLLGHEVKSTGEMGWERLVNGQLLAAAATRFDVLLTVDKGIKYQQNLAKLPLSVIIIRAKSNTLVDLVSMVPKIEEILRAITPYTLIEISSP